MPFAFLIALATLLASTPGRADVYDCQGEFHMGYGYASGLADCMERAKELEGKRARSAAQDGNDAEKEARRDTRLGDQLGRDREKLQNDIDHSSSGLPPAEASRVKAEILDRPYNPPSEFRDQAKSMGLNRMGDLLREGAARQKQLYENAESAANKAADNYRRAEQAVSTGDKFGNLRNQARERAARMYSADRENRLLSSTPAAATPGTAAGAAEGQAIRQGASPRRASEAAPSPAHGATALDAPAKSAEAKPGEGASESRARAQQKLRLAEKLKQALAAGRRAEAELLQRQLAELEAPASEAGMRELASAARPTNGEPAPGFSLSGSATENAVQDLIRSFEHGQDEQRDTTLFDRIHRPIRRCLQAGCVAGR